MSSNTRLHSAALERESAEIRADMDATLSALERKLSPGQLVDRSMELLREHGGEFAANFGRQVRENPVPFVFAAAGIAWLMAANNAPRHRAPSSAEEHDTTDGSSPGIAQQLGSAAQSSTQGVHKRFLHKTEQVREQASAATDRVRSAAHQTRERAHQAKDSFVTLLDEQPVAVGAMGVALGALLGAILPSSRLEDELLGPKRDQALDKAKEMGADRYARLRDEPVGAADRTKDAARQAEGVSAHRDKSVGSP